jgi:spore cortex formation protein SpoVR/YcgB (stage V sporulation)
MAPTNDETIEVEMTEVVATPKRDASWSSERISYKELETFMTPTLVSCVATARELAQREGFTDITGRITLEHLRSDEVHDCVSIIKKLLAIEFADTHQVFTIYFDGHRQSSSEFDSNANRDLTFTASPL